MKKILAGVVALMLLAGCIDGQEKKMKDVCKEIALNHAVDPSAVSFNEVSLLSSKMKRDEFVRDYYGSEQQMSSAQRAALNLNFKEGGEGATRHIVSVDYTDKSKGESNATRDRVVCIYIEYADSTRLNAFSVKSLDVSKDQFFDYFMLRKTPKGLSPTGKINLR